MQKLLRRYQRRILISMRTGTRKKNTFQSSIDLTDRETKKNFLKFSLESGVGSDIFETSGTDVSRQSSTIERVKHSIVQLT